MEKIQNLVGGRMIEPKGEAFLEKVAPATGLASARVPDSAAEDVAGAVEAAAEAFPAWSRLGAADRGAVLAKIADGLERSAADFARAESLDTGRLVSEIAARDLPNAVATLRFWSKAAGEAEAGLSSEAVSSERPRAEGRTVRRPLGVVACLTPWSASLELLVRAAAPALAAGNCVVAKPSELAPTTAFMLSKLCLEAAVPPGVLGVVHGQGPKVGPALVGHEDVTGVAFTGSTANGAEVMKVAGPQFKRVALHLGAKNAAIVFGEADFALAVRVVLDAAFSSQGQSCLAASRILVEQRLLSRFKDALIAGASKLVPGDPLDAQSTQGALVSRAHLERVQRYVAMALGAGGKVLCGGERVKPGAVFDKGFYYRPTLVEGLVPNARVNQEEIFGPVATLLPFASEEEALRIANGTRFGLAATVFSKDPVRARRVAGALRVGTVWINGWGGGDSGLGRGGGPSALRSVTETTNVFTVEA